MLISTIIPIYKGKKYIEMQIRQIEEAARRIDGDLELIFVNDYPKEPIEEDLSSEYMEIVVMQTDINRGIQGARVYALSKARGEYIHFLDQDDEIYPDFYRSQLECIGDADMVYCRCYYGNREAYTLDQVFETVMDRDNILRVCPLRSPGQALIRKSSIPKIWRDNIIPVMGSDDYMIYLIMYEEGRNFNCNQDILYKHITTGENVSSDLIKAYESDRCMIDLLLENNVFSKEDIPLARQIPEVNFKRKYDSQRKNDTILKLISAVLMAQAKRKSFENYFKDKNIDSIAIYGAGICGKDLYYIMKQSDLKPVFFIDRSADFLNTDIPVYKLEDAPDKVDAVLISVITHEDEIEKQIKDKYDVPVFRIKDVVRSIGS